MRPGRGDERHGPRHTAAPSRSPTACSAVVAWWALRIVLGGRYSRPPLALRLARERRTCRTTETMADPTPVYELTLLLSTDAEEDTRARILGDLEAAITRGGGSIVRKTAWGNRSLAYRIDHEDDAEIHLFELTAPPNLLADLNHTLRITDGVLRFRVIKAISGGQQQQEPEPAAASVRGSEEAGGGEGEG